MMVISAYSYTNMTKNRRRNYYMNSHCDSLLCKIFPALLFENFYLTNQLGYSHFFPHNFQLYDLIYCFQFLLYRLRSQYIQNNSCFSYKSLMKILLVPTRSGISCSKVTIFHPQNSIIYGSTR